MPTFKSIFITMVLLLIGVKVILSEDNKTITFQVITDSLPPEEQVCIIGNQNKLGNWEKYNTHLSMVRVSDTLWSRSFTFSPGTHLEFKFTRGSWRNEAVDPQGIEYPNFVLDVHHDTTLTYRISGWRDYLEGITVLSKERFANKNGQIEFFENWRYHPGDNPDWAEPDFDDSDWQFVSPLLRPDDQVPGGWQGIGWFRLHLLVDSSLWEIPQAFHMHQIGASEVYLNGQLLYQYGRVGNTREEEEFFRDLYPRYINFPRKSHQVLAIRYSNFSSDYYNKLDIVAGFYAMLIEDLNLNIRETGNDVRYWSINQMVFTILPLSIAVMHLFLFFFFYARSGEFVLFHLLDGLGCNLIC